MRKTIFLTIILFVFSPIYLNCTPARVSPRVSVSAHFTLWEQLEKALCFVARHTLSSKYLHGASLATFATIVLDVSISISDELTKKHDLLPTPTPSRSFLLIILASIYGSYLSGPKPKTLSQLCTHGFVAGVIPTVIWTLWKVGKGNFTQDGEKFGIAKQSKNGLRQAILGLTAFASGHFITKTLKKLDY